MKRSLVILGIALIVQSALMLHSKSVPKEESPLVVYGCTKVKSMIDNAQISPEFGLCKVWDKESGKHFIFAEDGGYAAVALSKVD